MKLLWVDSNHALIYKCGRILQDGTCGSDVTYVNIMSRGSVITEIETEAIRSFAAAAAQVCLELGDLQQNSEAGLTLQYMSV